MIGIAITACVILLIGVRRTLKLAALALLGVLLLLALASAP